MAKKPKAVKKKTEDQKPEKPQVLNCSVEVDEELIRIEITRNREEDAGLDTEYPSPFTVYRGGDLDDSNETAEEILDSYGEVYWDNLDDFAANRKNGKSLKAWLEP